MACAPLGYRASGKDGRRRAANLPGSSGDLPAGLAATIPARDPDTQAEDLRALAWSSIDSEVSRDLDQLEVAAQLPGGTVRVRLLATDPVRGFIDFEAIAQGQTGARAGDLRHMRFRRVARAILILAVIAVIALNFTVNADYPALASNDNTVTRLFGLNYLTLALSLVINITVFRCGLVARAFGKYAQQQLFRFLVWGLPLSILGTAAAIILVAMA